MQKCHITTRREKKELQKILDRKRLNSIIEAKKAEKDKAEAWVMVFLKDNLKDSASDSLGLKG